MPTLIVLAKEDGGVAMTDYQRATYRDFIKKNAGKKVRIVAEELTPESKNQRRFYHGAVLTLWAYLDGNDYKNPKVLEHYHEFAKKEFNPEILIINGKKERFGKSTKGELNHGYVEKVIENLVDQYGIDPAKVLNVELYKKFRDQINIMGDYDTFIDYMIDVNILNYHAN